MLFPILILYYILVLYLEQSQFIMLVFVLFREQYEKNEHYKPPTQLQIQCLTHLLRKVKPRKPSNKIKLIKLISHL